MGSQKYYSIYKYPGKNTTFTINLSTQQLPKKASDTSHHLYRLVEWIGTSFFENSLPNTIDGGL